jgi:4-amino-4-deoxy-L-arabinose transferase-like glycosyltransferase
VGTLSALAWSLLTPTFQVPDEPVHVGYAQYIAETGKPPRSITARIFPSRDETLVYEQVPFSLLGKPTWSPSADRALDRAIQGDFDRAAEGGAGYAANNPPLYYYAAAVPYKLASGGDFLDRMWAMRFFSALLAGFTVAFVFMFLRELFPRTPLAWTVGSLAVALHPVFGFMGGGVNNDNLLWLTSAIVLWMTARIFRRGLTPSRGLVLGLAFAAGVLTKTSMVGLAPGLVLGVALAVWRTPRAQRALALRGAGLAVAASAVPIAAWLWAQSALLDRPAVTTSTGGLTTVTETSINGQLSYLWQFYLPRLPFMDDWFPKYPDYPVWDTLFQGFVGRFGWFENGFPLWVNVLGLVVVAALSALAGRALWTRRVALRSRWPEILTYAALVAGLLLVVHVAGYRYRVHSGLSFEQTRYLFPLIGLWGALVALAIRGAGRRWRPVLAVGLTLTFVAWQLFAQLIVVGRYYA